MAQGRRVGTLPFGQDTSCPPWTPHLLFRLGVFHLQELRGLWESLVCLGGLRSLKQTNDVSFSPILNSGGFKESPRWTSVLL